MLVSSLSVRFGDHGCDCRQCLSTSVDVYDREASCTEMVNQICPDLHAPSSSFGGESQSCPQSKGKRKDVYSCETVNRSSPYPHRRARPSRSIVRSFIVHSHRLAFIMYPNMKLRNNRSWDSWGSQGLILGGLLLFLGLVIQVLEYPRIYNGPTNEETGVFLYQNSNYFHHWWPWTYAASIFGLLTFFAGLMGIIAGCRRTYGSIFIFFALALLSLLMSIYLIVYFSIIIGVYRSVDRDSSAESVGFGLAGTQLALACLNFLLSLIAAIVSARAIRLCTPKGVYYEDVRPMGF